MNRIIPLQLTYSGNKSSIGAIDNVDGVLYFKAGTKYTLSIEQSLVARSICRCSGTSFYAFVMAISTDDHVSTVQLVKCNWVADLAQWHLKSKDGLYDTRPSKILSYLTSAENRQFTVEQVVQSKPALLESINSGTFDISVIINKLVGQQMSDNDFKQLLSPYFEVV